MTYRADPSAITIFLFLLSQSHQASCNYLNYLKYVATAISKAITLSFSHTLFCFMLRRQNKHNDYGKEIRDKYRNPQTQNVIEKQGILNGALMPNWKNFYRNSLPKRINYRKVETKSKPRSNTHILLLM